MKEWKKEKKMRRKDNEERGVDEETEMNIYENKEKNKERMRKKIKFKKEKK